MKVLNVISSMDPAYGGTCQGLRNSIPELTNLNVLNEVVCVDEPGADYLRNDVFKIHALGGRKTSWAYSKALLPWLLTNMTHFDVVVVHGMWQYAGYAVRKAAEVLKKERGTGAVPRIFIMPHGMLDPYFQKASGRRVKAIRNWLYYKLIEGENINNANGLLFTCMAEMKLARQPFRPYKPVQEHNIGYGINLPPALCKDMITAFRSHVPALKNEPFFLFLSRIHEKKGLMLLINAYHHALQHTAQLPHLVVAGPGLDSAFGSKVFEMVHELGIQHQVHFPGLLLGKAKWGAFYDCTAFVLPSHQENFGISIVEAMACGKPVLISDQVNIWEEIKAADAGLVEADTIEGVKRIFKQWIALSPEQIKVMGKNARSCVDTHFSMQPVAYRMKQALF
ncbi:Glycosyltransferase involved in cell wall bisynthesis [Cnuella takakiae]|uniref:Glycosyltransferase involved in cell wall bisynthesis n=1 Tax=Cnuella takakiae TaxID=1302690 RepID=A0A1M5E200_9BACT|nr:glycosyltransferase [Cnuella takakiae]OLY94964.1 glycosyl transferase family 1 [Cnuella takakiae]SHF73259.1 Glycosyltransferase involved in cell wall bisynthesis [Cnuella takakiae]